MKLWWWNISNILYLCIYLSVIYCTVVVNLWPRDRVYLGAASLPGEMFNVLLSNISKQNEPSTCGGGEGGGGGVSPLPPRVTIHHWAGAGGPPCHDIIIEKLGGWTTKEMEIIEKRECRLDMYIFFANPKGKYSNVWAHIDIFYVAMWWHGGVHCAGRAGVTEQLSSGQMNISIGGRRGQAADGSHRHSYFSARIFQIITQAFIKWHTVCAPGSEFIFLM